MVQDKLNGFVVFPIQSEMLDLLDYKIWINGFAKD